MKELREKVENLDLKNEITKDLVTLLDDHFNCKRFNDNKSLDYYSITRLFREYTTLNYVISKNIQEMGKDISELYKECSNER